MAKHKWQGKKEPIHKVSQNKLSKLQERKSARKKDVSANKHVVRRDGFVDYPQVSAGTQYVTLGNETREEVFEMQSYQLRMSSGRMLCLHDVLYAPGIR
ncbi:hypothetical protein COLO4_28341 [Corchorus olitorius]|uniref:Uncharacterized protein n=1 Tax=Corchorus olitorius TaxID=93759 RepID=A0A1R3HLI4_9ROSI|nr:hypothetical protein COLO4_28341 [Corchorus olitorius]